MNSTTNFLNKNIAATNKVMHSLKAASPYSLCYMQNNNQTSNMQTCISD